MSFSAPIPTLKKSRQVSAGVIGCGRGSTTLRLCLRFGMDFPELPAHCDIRVGEGVDEGQLMLKFSEQGSHKLYTFKVERRRELRLEPPACVPDGWLFERTPCHVDWLALGNVPEFIVRLPLERWRKLAETLNTGEIKL